MTRKISTQHLADQWELIWLAFRHVDHAISADIERDGLPMPWFTVLLQLHQAPDAQLPMSPLATRLDMTSGGYTKLIDRMEAAGLVERTPAADDRRMIYTALTEHGRQTAEEAIARYQENIRKVLLGTITEDQLRTLAAIMEPLLDAHEPERPETP